MKTRSLQRIVTKWRRARERHKRLAPLPPPAKRAAELRAADAATNEPT